MKTDHTACFFEAPARKTEASSSSSSRTRSAHDSLARILPHARERFGITRLANITGLDHIGLPVWQAIRPNARSLSISQGKASDTVGAKISAIMESLESYHAEHARCDVRIETYRALAKEGGARILDPLRLPRSRFGHFHIDASLPWTRARHLETRDPVFVPYELVHTNFTVPRIAGSGTFIPSTNGLGAGNHPTEAVLHGVCELIERDAEALWRLGGERTKHETRVAVESVSGSEALALVDLFRQAGLELMIWDMTTNIGIACFSVVVFDLESDPDLFPRPAAEGSGCHLRREVALCRALAEAAQSRLTSIAGSRDDFSTSRYEAFQSRESLDGWRKEVSAPTVRRFDQAPDYTAKTSTIDEDLAFVVKQLDAQGINDIVTVDLTLDPSLGFTFLRVIVPGLEGSMGSPSYMPGERGMRVISSRKQHDAGASS